MPDAASFICFPQLACLFLFEVFLKLLPFRACDPSSISLVCFVFFRAKSHEGGAWAPSRVFFCPITGLGLVPLTTKAGDYPCRLNSAGHKAQDEALASGGEDRDEPPQDKWFSRIGAQNENIAHKQ